MNMDKLQLMPGFMVWMNPPKDISSLPSVEQFQKVVTGEYAVFINRVHQKFPNDQIFHEDSRYVLILDGVLLNSAQFLRKWETDRLALAILQEYQYVGELFLKNFKGSFAGMLYDKAEKKWIAFTNQTGDKTVFYVNDPDIFLVGSNVNLLSLFLRKIGKKLHLHLPSAYSLLTYGYMLGPFTLISEIQKLPAGHYLLFRPHHHTVHSYFELNTDQEGKGTLRDFIDEFDRRFREAVRLEYEKDREYGYPHLASLSGGLDSRMALWVANSLGFSDITTFCFSQSGYVDARVAEKIASNLGNEFIFKSLDGGRFLTNLETMVTVTQGLSLYSGNAHGMDFVRILNWGRFGLVHSGQLGDVIAGTFVRTEKRKKITPGQGAYSTKLIHKLISMDAFSGYFEEEEEKFLLYQRGFNGALIGNLVYQLQTEIVSPFMDVDVMEFCLQIPRKLRLDHEFYFQWILSRYPDAGSFPWEKLGARIDRLSSRIKIFLGDRRVRWPKFKKELKKKIFEYLGKQAYHMNPYDYWYKKSYLLQNFFQQAQKDLLPLLDPYGELKKDGEWLYQNGNVQEKTQVLSLAEFIRQHELH